MSRMDNYPGGFKDGILIRGLPLHVTNPGKVFWVYNGTALQTGQKAGSDGNDGTFNAPFSTVDYAVGRCTANRGDVVFVKPGHAESITTHDQIDVDVAGVVVVNLGAGANRPTYTWDGTDATACIRLGAASTAWIGGLLVSSDTGNDITRLITIEADDVYVGATEFREGAGQYLTGITAIDGVDRFHVDKATFRKSSATGNNAISFTAASTAATGNKITDCHMYGAWSTGAILLADATQIQSDVLIKGNTIVNTSSADYAIDLTTGTNVTGLIADNKVETTAEATSIRSGGATLADNTWALDLKQSTTAGATFGSTVVSVAPQMTITSTTADEVAVVSAGGDIIITSIVGFCNTLHEAEAAAVFDNIVTGASGNLYAADQETALQDSAFEVGDYVVFAQDAPTVVEQATSQTEDSRGLNWRVAASDTIDIEGGSAEAEGKVTLVISYVSLGGELEVESV